MPRDTASAAGSSTAGAVAIAGLAIGVGAATSAVVGLNILVSLLLAGVAYMLSRVKIGTGMGVWHGLIPRLTILLIAFAVVYIGIADFITAGNSPV